MSERYFPSHPHQIPPQFSDEQLARFVQHLDVESQAPEQLQLPEEFSLVNPVNSLFTVEERESGSLDILHAASNTKIYIRRVPSEEYAKTQLLLSHDVQEVLPYFGQLATESHSFVYGAVPANTVNLASLKLDDTEMTEYFGGFDIVQNAAQILAKIHASSMVHGNFVIPNFTISTGDNRLSLFNNFALHQSRREEEQNEDINSFLQSLSVLNPSAPSGRYVQTFKDAYFQAITYEPNRK